MPSKELTSIIFTITVALLAFLIGVVTGNYDFSNKQKVVDRIMPKRRHP